MSHASELRLGNGAGAGLPRSVPRLLNHNENWAIFGVDHTEN
ncbi:MAG: hypothetical protein AB7F71_25145 [Burkholderiaceae bacterium]